MTYPFTRWLLALAAPLLLASCLAPGRFAATLEIGRDRSFTFTYVGEAVVTNPASSVQISTEGGETSLSEAQESEEMSPADRQRLIDALSREVGFRSVEYVGRNKFRIDYAISGRLDRSFSFPFNPDGMAFLPWILAEVRRDGTVQVTGGGFGDNENSGSGANAGAPSSERQGTFTLVTDADLVRHNSEADPAASGRKTLTWQVTPEPRPVPTALLRFAD